MSLFKYLTPEGTLRFLSTWAMRITPPDQFNDPFEMRPPVDLMTEDEYAELMPTFAREELPKLIAEEMVRRSLPVPADHPLFGMITMYLVGQLTPQQEHAFINMFPAHLAMSMQLPLLRLQFKRQLKDGYEKMALLNDATRKTLRESMQRLAGVLCMSRNGNQPLMWAHYGDEHRGAVIEFNGDAPCFNRRRTDEDEFGYFRRVTYTETRPTVRFADADQFFQVLALTKAAEWSYEAESRLIWPLSHADTVVNETVHLLSIPTPAVASITFGCRSSATFIGEVQSLLSKREDAAHVVLRRAVMDDDKFALNYVSVSA